MRHRLRTASNPALRPRRRRYLLRDEFLIDRAAGAINGTAAEPGPGVRTVTDTENKLSISGGVLTFAGGKTSPAYGDPGLWYPGRDRMPGRMLMATLTHPGSGTGGLGWDDNQSTGPSTSSSNYMDVSTTTLRAQPGTVSLGTITGGVAYPVAIPLRVTGAFYFTKISNAWTLLWVAANANGATMYPSAQIFSAAQSVDSMRVPDALWLPTPLISHGFGSVISPSDGLGHAEGVAGGIGSGGAGVALTQAVGTWGVSSGKAQASALSSGQAIVTAPVSTADVLIGADLVHVGGGVGVIARYADASNYLLAYHDGTNAILLQWVGGVSSTLISAAVTYSANARLWLWLSGTSARLYYNNALVGSTASINAALTAAVVGLRTSDTGNTIDNLTVYAVGTGGEYAVLNNY